MRQIHLIVYLEYKGCEEKKIGKPGWIMMFNPINEKISAVPVPSNGENLKPCTIVRVCKALDIEPPPTSTILLKDLIDRIDDDLKSRLNKK